MAKKPALKKRSALGKGLGALLSDVDTSSSNSLQTDNHAVNSISEIDVELIDANPAQPRSEASFIKEEKALHELADSIKEHGIIQPITVRKLSDKQFQLISGERRLRASKIAGLATIPAYIRTANDQQMLEMGLIENIQRQDLNPIEIALSYQRLMKECDIRQEDLGKRVGKDRTTVNNYVRLLKLPEVIQEALKQKELSMGHGRALINVEHFDQKVKLYHRIIKEKLSVRKIEEIVRELAKPSKKAAPKPQEMTTTQRAVQDVQQKLSSHFGTRVKVNSSEQGKGEIKIPFMDKDDLNRILDLLNY